MKQITRSILLVATTITIIFSGVSCSSQTSSGLTTQSTSLRFVESFDGRFYTNDLNKAQNEIPFNITLPTYIYVEQGDVPLPEIVGPLEKNQQDNNVQIEIWYIIDFKSNEQGIVYIREYNYPMLAGDPKLNPELESIEIKGKSVIKEEGNYQQGPGFIFYFNQEHIYFVVEVDNISTQETMKIVESMIK